MGISSILFEAIHDDDYRLFDGGLEFALAEAEGVAGQAGNLFLKGVKIAI